MLIKGLITINDLNQRSLIRLINCGSNVDYLVFVCFYSNSNRKGKEKKIPFSTISTELIVIINHHNQMVHVDYLLRLSKGLSVNNSQLVIWIN